MGVLCGAGLGFGLVGHEVFRLTGNEAVGWRGVFGLTGGKGLLLGSRVYVRPIPPTNSPRSSRSLQTSTFKRQ